jgi:hypothetical protein
MKVIKLAAVYKEQSSALICDEAIYINDQLLNTQKVALTIFEKEHAPIQPGLNKRS